jgi:hypothetical protein
MVLLSMKTLFLAVTIVLWLPVAVQAAEAILVKPEPSLTDQIKAARAKEDTAEKSASSVRPWDRDANGKRPWERNEPPK